MKKAGVIGYPITHSLSPKLHNYWLKKYNIDGEYKAIEVKPEGLADFIKNMAANGYSGVNVTIPHKEAVMEFLYEIDHVAKAIGAVNTIVVKDGKLIGKNTDVAGFAENIKSHIIGKKKAVIFGAGGAARAVGKALLDLDFSQITIANRTLAKADEVRHQFDNNLEVASWEERSHLLKDADLLVNTTSLGMTGKGELEIDLSLLPTTALVTDIVYNPLITPLLAQAQARGNPTVDGLGMLLHQAVPAFEAWFGVRPVVDDELRKYMLEK